MVIKTDRMVIKADRSVYSANENRYEHMSYRRVGDSGLKLSPLSLGFWHNFGSINDFENMKRLVRTAFDSGITSFDLANNYGPVYGSAEENFGRIMDSDFRPYRNEMVISSKAGYDMWAGPYGAGGSRKYLIASCDESLKRTKLDYFDLFYHHCMDPDTPVEETVEALNLLVLQGKALYVGISNYDRENTKRAKEYARSIRCPLIIQQRRFSLFDRSIKEDGTLEYCAENGIGEIAFCPLAQGLLTDRYINGIPADSRMARDSRFLHKEDLDEKKLEVIKKLNAFAAGRGQTLAEMALAWLLSHPAVCSVIIGASKPEQILINVKAQDHKAFSADELSAIDTILEELK